MTYKEWKESEGIEVQDEQQPIDNQMAVSTFRKYLDYLTQFRDISRSWMEKQIKAVYKEDTSADDLFLLSTLSSMGLRIWFNQKDEPTHKKDD